MQPAQPEYLDTFFQYIFGFFDQLFSTPLQPWIPWGPGDWYFTITTAMFVLIILYLVRRIRKGGGSSIADGVRTVIASTGDVSAGMSGAKKLGFLRDPADALVFLKIEENAVQQALTALDYYGDQGEINETVKMKLASVYQNRLESIRTAIAKDEQLKEIVATSDAVGKARSDYLRKLAAMSGTAVEADEAGGPPSVGMPSAMPAAPEGAAPAAGPPSGGPPSGGPPSGGPPSGGPPSGGPPSGGPPAGAAPAVAPPSAAPPSAAPPTAGPPGDAPPAGGPPGGAPIAAGPPGEAAPEGADRPSGGKSTLQSEMLREMERLKSLMGGD
ncbi:MAG: hypothetical protein ACFFCK_09270 [Promethearchaeota archaeon]